MYIEDVYEEFYTVAMIMRMPIQRSDQSAMKNFYNLCSAKSQLTEKQANFILRLLNKYKEASKSLDYDYEEHLQDPQWKQPFRVIDESRKVFIEKDSDGVLWVCLKFPFQLIKNFEDEVGDVNESPFDDPTVWDKDRRLKMIPLYKCNLVKIDEFVKKHGFEIDSQFENVVSTVEEIWQSSEVLIPQSVIENDRVILKNVNISAEEYFAIHSTGDIPHDLMLAKSMGYCFSGVVTTKISKIVSHEQNTFWVDNLKSFVDVAEQVPGKIAILMDRTEDHKLWISNFIKELRTTTGNHNCAKVCFRESNKTNPEFNTWLAEENLTGDLHDAKYLIFKNKLPKWLFKEPNDIKIVATNNVFPTNIAVIRHWLESHPCVIYISEYKPVFGKKDNSLVNL